MLDKTKTEQIPILDLSKFLEGDEVAQISVAADLRWIQEKIGFYYIINHGVASDLINAAVGQVQALHSLPMEEKLKVKVDKDTTGYIPIKSTMYVTTDASKNDNYDLNENYRIVRERKIDHPSILAGRRFSGPNKWPNSDLLPDFKSIMLKYYSAMESLGRNMLPLYARALDLAPDYLDGFFYGSHVVYPECSLSSNEGRRKSIWYFSSFRSRIYNFTAGV